MYNNYPDYSASPMHACYSSANTKNKFRPWTATEITFLLHGAKARLCTRKQTGETPNAAKKLRARSEMPLSRWRHQRLLRANSITPCPYREQLSGPSPACQSSFRYPHQHMAPNGNVTPSRNISVRTESRKDGADLREAQPCIKGNHNASAKC